MNSADHRGVAALNELETNEQTGHSCAPEVAGALNVGPEGQRKDTAGASHLSAAPQPVQTAEYDTEDEFRWPNAVTEPVQTADAGKRVMRMEATVTALSNGGESPFSAVQQAALASKPVPASEPADGVQLWHLVYGALWQEGKPKTYAEFERAAKRIADMLERRALAAQPVREPMSEEQIENMARDEQFLLVCDGLEELTEIIRCIERHHGITKE